MKNTYLTSYFPLLSIILFSLSLSIRVEMTMLTFLQSIGVYEGMLEFFTERGIKLALLFLLVVLFFMVFAALKLIADTINGLSLLFFSKDLEGESLKNVRGGSIIYFIGSALSLISVQSFLGIGMIFFITTIVYFVYFVYKVSNDVSIVGIFGMMLFQVIVWSTLLFAVIFLALKVYNSFIASLPI